MARVLLLVCLLAVVYSATAQENNVAENEIVNSRRISNGEELVAAVVDDCFPGEDKSQSSMSCLRMKVLTYLDSVMEGNARGRSLEEEKSDVEHLDAMIYSRVMRYLNTHEFKVQLPDFFFQNAVLTFRPSRGLSDFTVEFPEVKDESRAYSEARDMMKKKMLMPLLMLIKLKMKALTPLVATLAYLKAVKALVMSKVAILFVVGFLLVNLFKKLGMGMPMAMPMPVPAEPTPYGAPAPSSPPASSYEPGWDSGNGANGNGGGPYSRVWDAHQMAYNSYYNPQQTQQPQTQQ
ncbi:uncharacterized protein Osi20 [Anabrus simplex]|uniref:uncharacterized protein Osi20 n=1 Tax=Anabrus simplex TaxID=316456 RepID=UPI0034DD581A